jgi:hypothetical protein
MPGPIDRRRSGPPRGPVGPQGPTGPAETGGAEKAKAPKKTFSVGEAQRAAEQIKSVVRDNYELLQTRIRDGLGRGLGKEEILQELTRDELADAFGPNVSGEMVVSVSKAVMDEPSLSQIFSKLFKMAKPD